MKIDPSDEKRIKELVEVCKKHQGEHLDAHHGSGSWATTYSNFFINAAAEMFVIYEKNGSYWPIGALSRRFQEAGVRSCRGSVMTSGRVEYLYKTHLKIRIDDYRKS